LREVKPLAPGLDGAERRIKQRFYGLFTALVRGVDGGGEAFETHAEVDNISAGGLHLRLWKEVEPGATLTLLVRLTTPSVADVHGPLVLIRGRVLRAERQEGGEYALAVAITHHEFP